MALLKGFRASGGLMRLDELSALLEHKRPRASAWLDAQRARWAVCEWHWRGQTWLPVCQFDLARARLRPAPGRMARELGLSLSDRGCLLWLATAQVALNGQTPAQLLQADELGFEALARQTWGAGLAMAA